MGQRHSQQSTAEASSTASGKDSSSLKPTAHANLEAKLNPSADDARSHNFGQPIQPKDAKGASKLKTDCRAEQRASLQCIEENYENKDQACAQFFENYKKCRREEHERKLERNARGF